MRLKEFAQTLPPETKTGVVSPLGHKNKQPKKPIPVLPKKDK